MIRSKIDYGCIVCKSASSRELESLEPVSNKAMIMSSGCFKSTPIFSLQVITENIFVNNPFNYKSGILNFDLTDHVTTFNILKNFFTRPASKQIFEFRIINDRTNQFIFFTVSMYDQNHEISNLLNENYSSIGKKILIYFLHEMLCIIVKV